MDDFYNALHQVQAEDPMLYPMRVEWENKERSKKRSEDIMLMANMVKNRPVKLYDAETATYTPAEKRPATHDAEPTFWDGVILSIGILIAALGCVAMALNF